MGVKVVVGYGNILPAHLHPANVLVMTVPLRKILQIQASLHTAFPHPDTALSLVTSGLSKAEFGVAVCEGVMCEKQ